MGTKNAPIATLQWIGLVDISASPSWVEADVSMNKLPAFPAPCRN